VRLPATCPATTRAKFSAAAPAGQAHDSRLQPSSRADKLSGRHSWPACSGLKRALPNQQGYAAVLSRPNQCPLLNCRSCGSLIMLRQPTYSDLVELARVCRRMAENHITEAVRAEFLRMADEYRRRADALAPRGAAHVLKIDDIRDTGPASAQ